MKNQICRNVNVIILLLLLKGCGSHRSEERPGPVDQSDNSLVNKNGESEDPKGETPETSVETKESTPKQSAVQPAAETFGYKFNGVDDQGTACQIDVQSLKTKAELCVALQSTVRNSACSEEQRFRYFDENCSSSGYIWFESTVCKIWARPTTHAMVEGVQDTDRLRAEYFCAGRSSSGQDSTEMKVDLKDFFEGLSFSGVVHIANHQFFGDPLYLNLSVFYLGLATEIEFRKLIWVDFERTSDKYFLYGAECKPTPSCDRQDWEPVISKLN